MDDIYVDFTGVSSSHVNAISELAGIYNTEFKRFGKINEKEGTISQRVTVGPFLDLDSAKSFQEKANEKLDEVK